MDIADHVDDLMDDAVCAIEYWKLPDELSWPNQADNAYRILLIREQLRQIDPSHSHLIEPEIVTQLDEIIIENIYFFVHFGTPGISRDWIDLIRRVLNNITPTLDTIPVNDAFDPRPRDLLSELDSAEIVYAAIDRLEEEHPEVQSTL